MTANKSCAPVSVIIPCFNCAHSLERAVLSIVEQSVKPFEVILVDDASSDLTLEVITRIQRQYG